MEEEGGGCCCEAMATTVPTNHNYQHQHYPNHHHHPTQLTNPYCHLSPGLVLVDARIADKQHIRVVPVARSSKLLQELAVVAKVVDDALLMMQF